MKRREIKKYFALYIDPYEKGIVLSGINCIIFC